MKPTAFDRLIAMLPPERRAAAAVSLVGMSDDPDGPIATLYSEFLDRIDRVESEQRANHATLEKLLLGQFEILQTANQEAIRSEVGRPHQSKTWHRMLLSRMVAAAACLALVAVATPIVTRHVVRGDLATQQQVFQSAQTEAAARLQQTLKDHQAEVIALADTQRGELERIKTLLATNISRKSFQETIGHVINSNSPQVKTTIGPELVTLRILDNLTRKEQGARIIELKHGLTPAEIDILRKLLEATKTVSIAK